MKAARAVGLQNQSKWLAHVYTQPKTSSLGHGRWAAGVSNDSDIATILPVMHWESPEAATVHSHTCGVQ